MATFINYFHIDLEIETWYKGGFHKDRLALSGWMCTKEFLYFWRELIMSDKKLVDTNWDTMKVR